METFGAFVLGCLVGPAVLFLIWQYARDPFSTPSRRELLDRELDGVWDEKATAGMQPDTLRLMRRAVSLGRLERAGASDAVLLGELDVLEAYLADVGIRIQPLTDDMPHVARRVPAA